jgi:hypothetical protein
MSTMLSNTLRSIVSTPDLYSNLARLDDSDITTSAGCQSSNLAVTTLSVDSIPMVTDDAISPNETTLGPPIPLQNRPTIPPTPETQVPHNGQVQQLTAAIPSAPGPLAPVKRSAKMRPGSSNTPRHVIIPFLISSSRILSFRGLCSIDWCARNTRGTVAEFRVFYDNLQPAEMKVCG